MITLGHLCRRKIQKRNLSRNVLKSLSTLNKSKILQEDIAAVLRGTAWHVDDIPCRGRNWHVRSENPTTCSFNRWKTSSLLSKFVVMSISMITTSDYCRTLSMQNLFRNNLLHPIYRGKQAFLWETSKFCSIASLQPNYRRLSRQKYYQNAVKIRAIISKKS